MRARLGWMTAVFVGVAVACTALPLAADGRMTAAAIAGVAGFAVALGAGRHVTRSGTSRAA